MPHIARTLATFFLLSTTIAGCCRNGQIEGLQAELDRIEGDLNRWQDSAKAQSATIQRLKGEVDNEVQQGAAVKDSANTYIKDNELPAAYLQIKGKQPLEVVWEYLNEADAQQRELMFYKFGLLLIYHHQVTQGYLDSVSYNLTYFNQRKSECKQRTEDLGHDLEVHEIMLKFINQRIEELQNQKATAEDQLKN